MRERLRPCRRWRREAWREVDGLLSPARRRRLEAHVAACAGCRLYLEQARALDGILVVSGGIDQPRRGFEEQVLLGIAAGLEGLPAAPAPAARRPKPGRAEEEAADWWVLGGGLGVAALFGIAAVSLVPRLALRATLAAAAPGAAPRESAPLILRGFKMMAGLGELFASLLQSPQAWPVLLMVGVLALTLGWLHSTLSRSTS